jgi:hypothetical protein
VFTREIPASTDTSRWPLGIPRPDISSILRDSEPIVPSLYPGSRDVSLLAGISVVNRSSNVEGFAENYDQSSIQIRNPSLCENKTPLSIRRISRDSLHMSSVLSDHHYCPELPDGYPISHLPHHSSQHIHTCTHTYTHTYTHTHIQTYTHTNIHAYTHSSQSTNPSFILYTLLFYETLSWSNPHYTGAMYFENLQIFKSANMQICKYANMQICK